MVRVSVDFNKQSGKIKPMHAVNNGPTKKGNAFGKVQAADVAGDLWRDSGIPYARTHDSSFCASYGGEHTIDIQAIFPDFDADVNDPASYDFPVTDAYVKRIHECGTETFYRLGTKIEHQVKKYNIYPPKDFKKWAMICEHIIMHYNEGWADGFHYGIKYWEIWNEPDLDTEESTNRRTWGGTELEFFELYETAATHLKQKFPHLKMGGPASAFRKDWQERFWQYLTRDGKKVPLDFFSWHCYAFVPERLRELGGRIRQKLAQYGYTETESILDEWNYVKSWDNPVYNVKTVISIKGAAFTASCMCISQNEDLVDMLMYYDARPSTYNGLFDFYTKEPLKGYYPFKMFNILYRLGNAHKCTIDGDNIYASAASKGNETAALVCYYTDDDTCTEVKEIKLDFACGAKKYEIFLLDCDHDAQSIGFADNGSVIEMKPNSVCLLKSAD